MEQKRLSDRISTVVSDRYIPGIGCPTAQIHSYRSIWISDLHLGTSACNAHALLDFLRSHDAERLYLVGDIVDGWTRGPSWYWDAIQESVVREIGAWRSRGTEVVFLPGNHDETNVDLVHSLFGKIAVKAELVHSTAEGRRMLVIHGHQFDGSLSSVPWLSKMGGRAYTVALKINDWSRREHLRPDAVSLGACLKRRITKAVNYLSATSIDEREILRAVRKWRADGVICGHTHRAEQRLIGPIWYLTEGDWIHNCTALVEHYDGILQFVKWRPKQAPIRYYGSAELGTAF
jgi:UDP-2,3-diacylglucosamine pyrophosphatase LpxH